MTELDELTALNASRRTVKRHLQTVLSTAPTEAYAELVPRDIEDEEGPAVLVDRDVLDCVYAPDPAPERVAWPGLEEDPTIDRDPDPDPDRDLKPPKLLPPARPVRDLALVAAVRDLALGFDVQASVTLSTRRVLSARAWPTYGVVALVAGLLLLVGALVGAVFTLASALLLG